MDSSSLGRSQKCEDAIASSGLLKPDKGYIYNPRIVVSRNRLDVKVTVVEGGMGASGQ